MKKLLVLAALVAAAASVMVVPTTAGAEPGGGADVVNQIGCGFLSPTTGKFYVEGAGVIVTSPSGQTKTACKADLVAGQTAVTETTHTTYAFGTLECDAVETKSGNVSVSCHGELP